MRIQVIAFATTYLISNFVFSETKGTSVNIREALISIKNAQTESLKRKEELAQLKQHIESTEKKILKKEDLLKMKVEAVEQSSLQINQFVRIFLVGKFQLVDALRTATSHIFGSSESVLIKINLYLSYFRSLFSNFVQSLQRHKLEAKELSKEIAELEKSKKDVIADRRKLHAKVREAHAMWQLQQTKMSSLKEKNALAFSSILSSITSQFDSLFEVAPDSHWEGLPTGSQRLHYKKNLHGGEVNSISFFAPRPITIKSPTSVRVVAIEDSSKFFGAKTIVLSEGQMRFVVADGVTDTHVQVNQDLATGDLIGRSTWYSSRYQFDLETRYLWQNHDPAILLSRPNNCLKNRKGSLPCK
ncbi:MAG: hypothetical protein COT74_04845 [Bdellovibrionales bacterium CG10_big_fil_rev_8_21_14_0_10_45_34]|nr:MAG: hypothetical protein COT74_04845 [Bdellovibrionales bacterium CG10_big_fil_rev_8_21_14_0_10_45_34]